MPVIITAALLLVLYLGAATAYEPVRSLRFLVDLLKGHVAVGLCAIGMTFVILGGGIDLSVGAVMALVTVLVAYSVNAGVPLALAFTLGLLAGLLFGLVSGGLVYFLGLPAFLVTLAGMFFARGLAFWVSPLPVSISHPGLEWILDELGFRLSLPLLKNVWIPPTVTLLVMAFLVAANVLAYTRFGRHTLAVGGDQRGAELMGLPVASTTLGLYAVSGLCAALAGVVTVWIDGAGKPNVGVGLELDAIAAVVIGGTLLTGGVGTMGGTFLGLLVIGIVRAVIIFDGRLPSPWQHITVGLLLLAFISLQQLLLYRGAKRSNSA